MTSSSITVLLTTLNRSALLHDTLRSLSELDAEGIDWEIVAVDNGSTDDTPAVMSRAAKRGELPLRTFTEPRPGKSRALNLGLKHAAGALIVFTDDDVVMASGWLRAYVDARRRWPDKHIFGGPVYPRFPEGMPAWVADSRYVDHSPMFARYAPMVSEGLTRALPHGPNMAISRELIGTFRFDERFGPGGDYAAMGCETEFVRRLIAASGEQVVYVPEASVEHVVRPEQVTKRAVWARAYNWGRSKALSDSEAGGKAWFFGAPLKHWLAAARSLVRFAPFYFGPRHWHLRYGWQWNVRWGRLRGYFEARRLNRRKQPAARDDGK